MAIPGHGAFLLSFLILECVVTFVGVIKSKKDMADVSSLTGMISALRAEVEQDSITPERLGYLLQCIVDHLSSYADAVRVGTLEQGLTNALSRVSSLEGHDVVLDSDIAEIRRIINVMSRVIQTNGTVLENLGARVVRNEGALMELQEVVGSLGEVYCTESEYNAMVESGTVDANKKYYIYES